MRNIILIGICCFFFSERVAGSSVYCLAPRIYKDSFEIDSFRANFEVLLETIGGHVTDHRMKSMLLGKYLDSVPEICPSVGDGKTDNFALMQKFINDNAGKTIVIPKGNFYISNTLIIPPNTTIIGSPSRLFNIVSDTLLIVKSGVKINNIELQGIGNKTISFKNIGIFHSSPPGYPDSNVMINNCYIHDFGNFGLYLINLRNSEIKDSRIDQTGYAGIAIYSGDNVNVTHCIINDVIPNGIGDAYGVAYSTCRNPGRSDYPQSKNSTVKNCTISNVNAWHGIDCHGANNIKIISNNIDYCKVGIYLTFFGPSDSRSDLVSTSNSEISGNTINGRGMGNGIDVFGYSKNSLAENNKIIGNTIINAGILSNKLGGSISVYRTKNIVISNNIIRNSITNGILAAFININMSITYNNIINFFGTSPTSGIIIPDSYNTGDIQNNTISSDTPGAVYDNQYGIRIIRQTNNNLKISNNRVTKVKKPYSINN